MRTAKALTSEEELYSALAHVLEKKARFVPRVVTHESQPLVQPTSFHVVSPTTLGYLRSEAQARLLTSGV